MSGQGMSLTFVDWLVMLVYFVFVLGIGYVLKSYMRTTTDFFMAGRSMPAWVAGLAFISANLGAQEVMGMAASGAKYGIATSHFYWIGAIPAMVFVGLFMMPFYYGSKAHSVPEYLRLRFDEKTRAFNAMTFAVMTVFSSGISMFAMARLIQDMHLLESLHVSYDASFHVSIVISGLIVLFYIFLGGLTSAIYNEVLQFFLIVAGFLPLVLLGLHGVGGWHGLQAKLPQVYMNSWAGMDSPQHNLLGVEWFGLVMGLGFVLSFGYWCTDFLVVQRAMSADSMVSARRVPLIAALPKMLFPALVILPGLIAAALTPGAIPQEPATKGFTAPAAIVQPVGGVPMNEKNALIRPVLGGDGQPKRDAHGHYVYDYNMVIPNMLAYFFPTGILGLGLTALLASFMSGMAGNVTAFNTVWTYDIYRSYIHKGASDEHYLWMGRMATVFGILVSAGAAYLARSFNNIMDALQMVFSFVNAPLFATFLLGMFWKRATGHGAFWGLLSGTAAAAIHHGLTLPAGSVAGIKGGWLTSTPHVYYSDLAQSFWGAIWAWGTCFVVTILISLFTRPRAEEELRGLVYSLTPRPEEAHLTVWQRPVTLGIIVIALVIALNVIFA
jgi:SSS family solute:Na+ symporter